VWALCPTGDILLGTPSATVALTRRPRAFYNHKFPTLGDPRRPFLLIASISRNAACRRQEAGRTNGAASPCVSTALLLANFRQLRRADYFWPIFASSSGCPNTAIHPVKQLGNTLLAPSGAKIRLLPALAATEWAVLAGC
jgi:hypothetical protein